MPERWSQDRVRGELRLALARTPADKLSPEGFAGLMQVELLRIAGESGWTWSEVSAQLEAVNEEQTTRGRGGFALLAWLGLGLFVVWVLYSNGIRQLGLGRFWLFIAAAIGVTFLVYMVVAGIASMVIKLAPKLPSGLNTVAQMGVVGCGCLLPLLALAASYAGSRAVYLWIMPN